MYANGGILLKSTDGGYTWQDQNRPVFQIISLSPYDDKIMFGIDYDNSLIKSLDSGNTYYTVDTANWDSGSQMYFDPDGVHIYCVSNGYNYNFMKLSTGGGEPFSWVIKKQSDIPIYLSNDSEIPGFIFYANGKNIYKSNDFGITFNLYKTLERNIVGIYKKPNEDKLYAATKYKIYEITNNSMIVLKSLPIPSDVFDWFPLAIGNKWVYNITSLNYYCWPDTQYVKSFEITKDTLISGIRYFKFEPPLRYEYKFIRIDSLDGHLKTLYNFFGYYDTIEISIYDFLMEVGDTVYLNPQEQLPDAYYLASEETNFVLGENRVVRTLYPISFYFPQYSLAYQIGYLGNYSCEFGGSSSYLKGCIINGIVYGDTTVTSVKEDQTVPKEFVLYQNFPNPFNPSTAIDYDLPVSSRVTLKIFDILGREIETLVDEFQQAGSHSAQYLSNAELPSGVYFYQLAIDGGAKNFISVKKMMLLK
ncbi:MAG: T9SS type A sorting domain-containing protein [Ignavibacteriales bacterium]|nr:T9SS type A sorting domain-containing protein [Ignavibacteriales bacterium]